MDVIWRVYGWQVAFVKAREDDGGLTGPLAKAAELLLLAEPFGAEEAPPAQPRQRRPASERAFAPRDGESSRARHQAKRGSARDPAPPARRQRGGEGADGRRNARLQRRTQIPRGPRGVSGVFDGGADVGDRMARDLAGAGINSADFTCYTRVSTTFKSCQRTTVIAISAAIGLGRAPYLHVTLVLEVSA